MIVSGDKLVIHYFFSFYFFFFFVEFSFGMHTHRVENPHKNAMKVQVYL